MTRTTIALLTSAAMVIGSAVTVSGQGKKGSTPKPTHVTTSKPTTTKVSSAKAPSGPKKTTAVSQTSKAPKGVKTTTAKATKAPKTTTAKATKAPKTTTKTAKATTSKSSTKSAKADTKVAKSESKPSKTEKTSKTEKSTTAATTTTDGEGDTPTTTPDGDGDTPETLTKVQEKLQKNTKLAEKLEGRLPAGTDLMEAAEGFKNLGQFVAAVNVSNNLGLDFDTLKTAMVDDGKSLGQAIQSLKSDVESPTVIATKAETEAQTLIQQTEKQTTTTATASTTTTSTKTKSKDKPKRTLRTQSGS